jgi:hypothetical protein
MLVNCRNKLKIEGAVKEIDRFVSQGQYRYQSCGHADEGIFTFISFQRLIPVPKELYRLDPSKSLSPSRRANLIIKYGFDDLVRWQMENWGDDSDINVPYYDKETNTFTFSTLWGPVTNGFVNISKLFPLLKFTYEYADFQFHEEGVFDCGKLTFSESSSPDASIASCGRQIIKDGCIEDQKYWRMRFVACKHCGDLIEYEKKYVLA